MLKKIFLFLPFVLFLGSSALSAQQASSTVSASTATGQVSDGVSADYILQPTDLIMVQVFQEDDLRRETRISQENTVTLPLIGSVEIGGKTVRQAEELIRDLYGADYLVNPQVTIIVLDYMKRTVNVIGQVNAPGPILFPQEKGITLMEAISRAGGFTRLANQKRVRVTRVLPSGETRVFIVNVAKIIEGGTGNIPLELNDTVYVDEIIL